MVHHRTRGSTAAFVLGAVLAAACGAGVTVAHAQAALGPSEFVFPLPTISVAIPPFGDTFADELSSSVSNTIGTNVIAGNLISAVYRNSGGTLDFFYQFQFYPTTNVDIESISVSSFAADPNVLVAQTTDDIDAPKGDFIAGTVGATFATEDSQGDGIDISYVSKLSGGDSTYTFIVRTSALTYADTGSVGVQGAGGGSNSLAATTLAPATESGHGQSAAPEPGSLPLVATAAALFMCTVVRRLMLPARNRQGGSLMQL